MCNEKIKVIIKEFINERKWYLNRYAETGESKYFAAAIVLRYAIKTCFLRIVTCICKDPVAPQITTKFCMCCHKDLKSKKLKPVDENCLYKPVLTAKGGAIYVGKNTQDEHMVNRMNFVVEGGHVMRDPDHDYGDGGNYL